jgi:hypothetical protein
MVNDKAVKILMIGWTGHGPMVEKRNATKGNQQTFVVKYGMPSPTGKIEVKNEETYLKAIGCVVMDFTELADEIVLCLLGFATNPRDVSNASRGNFTTIFLPQRTDTGETESDYFQ